MIPKYSDALQLNLDYLTIDLQCCFDRVFINAKPMSENINWCHTPFKTKVIASFLVLSGAVIISFD